MLSILKKINQTSFKAFVRKCFKTVNPATQYLDNWHVDAICEHLIACEKSQLNRLIINIPPRYMKSLIVNVAWPAWLLGKDPSQRIISASYSNALSIKHSIDCRQVMNENWYKKTFQNTKLSKEQNEKEKFLTNMRGFRLATSTGGTLTGEGGNFLILDDPNNPAHIMSKSSRDETLRWYEQVFSTRLDNRNKGVIVIIMQRLHAEDLTGLLLEKSDIWQVLKLPAILENNLKISDFNASKKFNKLIAKKPKKTPQALHQKHQSIKDLERTKKEIGSFAFSAQYLQNPLASDDGMIKSSWLRYFEISLINLVDLKNPIRQSANQQNFKNIIQSWDTAIKTGKNNDYSVCTTWHESENGFYLLDLLRVKAEYPELKRLIVSAAEKWRPEKILIEDKASGQSLIQEIKGETQLPIIPIKVNQDKISRLAGVTPLFESGRVFLPKHSRYLSDLEVELLSFPDSPHDDQVDSISQYLNYKKSEKLFQPNIRRL